MYYSFCGRDVFYNYIDRGSASVLVCLHGWGRSSEDFAEFIKMFDDRSILVIDFPPFGDSKFEPLGWTVFSYASMVISLCEHLNISSCDILGHSFGGRIAVIISAIKCSFVHSCILVDSAGMKPQRSISYRINKIKYRFDKFLKRDLSSYGSADYKALSPQMKEVFKNIVGVYLEDYAKEIKSKTLIVWGRNDKETPVYMAKRLCW